MLERDTHRHTGTSRGNVSYTSVNAKNCTRLELFAERYNNVHERNNKQAPFKGYGIILKQLRTWNFIRQGKYWFDKESYTFKTVGEINRYSSLQAKPCDL